MTQRRTYAAYVRDKLLANELTRRQEDEEAAFKLLELRAEIEKVKGQLPRGGSVVKAVACYIAHVSLGWSLTRCARHFWCHAKSVRLWIERIEDARDDSDYDAVIARLEKKFSC